MRLVLWFSTTVTKWMALEGPRRFLLVDIITTAAIWMLLKSNLFENEKSAAAPQNLMGLLLLLATRCYWFCCCPEQLCWSPEMMIRHNDEMIGSTPKSALTAKLGFQWWFLALHKKPFGARATIIQYTTIKQAFLPKRRGWLNWIFQHSSRLHFIRLAARAGRSANYWLH